MMEDYCKDRMVVPGKVWLNLDPPNQWGRWWPVAGAERSAALLSACGGGGWDIPISRRCACRT